MIYPIEQLATLLEENDWLVMHQNPVAKQIDLNKGYTPAGFAKKVYHLHIKPVGDWDELYFRGIT